MECKACGHRHCVWDGDLCQQVDEGTKPFLAISGAFYIEEPWEAPRKTSLHACPICGTVRIGS